MQQPMAPGAGNTRDASGAHPARVRGIAVLSSLGGLFLAAHATLMALKPQGCGGDACIAGSYREAGPLETALFLAAVVLISATMVGLSWLHRFEGPGSRLVRIASLTAAASLLIGVGLTPIFFWLAFAIMLVGILAFAATGAGLMRSRIFPAWSGALLILTPLLLFGFNTENEQVLFAIPFGVTWMILGGLLWSMAPSPMGRGRINIQHA